MAYSAERSFARLNRAWEVGRRILTAPVSRRSGQELGYALLSLPLALLGAAYVLVGFALGAGLAVTALGVPLLAAVVPGARGIGRARRWLARALLGERITAPAPLRPGPGLFAWLRAGLRDPVGWRAIGYVLLNLPIALLGLWVVMITWAWGLIALTYPVQHLLGVNQTAVRDAAGRPRQGFVLGDLVLTGPWLLLVSVGGAMLVLLAPWAVRTVLLLDRLLVRALLGDDRAHRIRELRRTRSLAVEDAAATLRRIERDLHDGVQARLVALAMNLTMVAETLGADASEPARAALATARHNARTAIAELRDVVRGIHPPALDNGLDDAIATLAAQGTVPVEVRTAITERPSPAIETIAYFCVAELLTNVARHSGASRATVEIIQYGDRLRLRVEDDGRGGARPESTAGSGGGSGLRGLADRVATVDGTLHTSSPAGGPTVVTVDLPLRT